MFLAVLGVIFVFLCSFVLSPYGKMAGERYRQMKVTMLRAVDKIMQELIFSNFYSAVSNFFVPRLNYGVGDCLSCQLFGSFHKFLQVMLV